MYSSNLPITIGCAALFAATAIGSLTASGAEPVLDELTTTVVTADLWQTPIERIPASVTVISDESLVAGATLRFEDVLLTVPNLTFTGGTSRARYFQIRGVGENSQFEGQTPDASVRFLVDDLDFTGLGGVGTLFDVSQAEVLRGPQAGAFGANASGGVIRIVTNAPTPYWNGFVEGTIGNDELFVGGFAIGGPLAESDPERLMFRLAIERLSSNGFRRNEFLDRRDTNKRDELLSRLRLTFNPNPDLTWDTTFFYGNQRNGYDEFSLGNTGFRTQSDDPGRDDQESFAGSIRGEWRGGDHAILTSITGISRVDSFYSFDADWTNTADPDQFYDAIVSIDRDRRNFSQEFRLDSIDQEGAFGLIDRWTLGTYFQHLREETEIDSFGDGESLFRNNSLAFYGQGAHDFNERTRAILGLRYEHYRVNVRSNPTDGSPTVSRRNSENLFGGKFTLEHDLAPEHRAFASLTRGYRGGGANVEIFGPAATQSVTFGTERIWNYEIGVRSEWMDSRLTTDITAFFLDRRNAQVRESVGDTIEFSFFTGNEPKIEHYGLEAQARYLLDPAWTLSGSLGLIETRRTDFQVTNPDGTRTPRRVDVGSRRLANAPPVSYSAALNYDDGEQFFGRLGISGRSSQFESNSHNEKQQAFTVVDLSLGMRVNQWTFTLWSKNLFDERYEKRIFFFRNEAPSEDRRYESPADPRTFGVTARYDF